MRRRGDLEEALSTAASAGSIAAPMLAYMKLLDSYPVVDHDPTLHTSAYTTHAGLWALLPLSLEERSLPMESSAENFADNPYCTDRTPLVGIRKGGREQRDPREQHSGTTVTVNMAAEASTALYGQYLHKQALAGSLRTLLSLSIPVGDAYSKEIDIATVVDTGAAWTAIRLAELLATIPDSKTLTFEEADISFTGISGKQLRCLGWTVLRLRFGETVISTKAFVFPDMHEPMLLGMNTLSAENLCVDVGRMGLYRSPREPLPPGAVPLFVGNPASAPVFYTSARRDTLYLARAGEVQASLPCSTTPPVSHRKGGGTMSKLPMLDTTPEEQETGNTASLLSLVVDAGPPSKLPLAEKCRRLDAVEDLQATGFMRRPHEDHLATAVVLTDTTFGPGETEAVHLYFVNDIYGKNRTLEVSPSAQFSALFPELNAGIESELVSLHASAQRVGQYRFKNSSDREVKVPAGAVFGSVRGLSLSDSNSFNLQHHPEWVLAQLENSAYRFDMGSMCDAPQGTTQQVLWALLSVAAASPSSDTTGQPLPPEEDTAPTAVEFEGIGASAVEFEYRPDDDCYETLPFDRGGKPRTPEDLAEMGLDLSLAVDASLPDCPLLEGDDKRNVEQVCIKQGAVWSRTAKVPRPAKHPWARCEIHVGDATPVQQKPYPIPHKYLPAVRKEIDGLLKAGLIEPGFGNWASPVICIIKKDSTAEEVRLKLAVDFRCINAVTIVDCALLGDQADILQCFHGRPHLSLCDAAGGFYQFIIPPEFRQYTGFVLPSSCGGTLFQWRVAPYGLTNMPAIYSRAMQHVLRGIVDTDLGFALDEAGRVIDPENGYLGVGSAPTWVDDITMASGGASPGYGIRGHCELLNRVFSRLILAGMTLKPSKSDILRQRLKVLGFEVTRDGISPSAEKVEAIKAIPVPSDPNAVLAFLGVINFNRAFIPGIGDVAHPLYELLKGYKSSELKARRGRNGPKAMKPFVWTDECNAAFEELKRILADECMTAHPDLTDPDAEFVLMTDASTKAAGAVLMQWQRKQAWDTTEIPEIEEEDGFDSVVVTRLRAGYTLKTLGFYSKTFANAQVNWAIFDKEAASIVMALTHWHRLVAGRPITVYTDNTVATSILTSVKFPRPPRLQRWGIVLGTYLPHLRIAYRRGELNPVADLMSRYPTQINYRPKDTDVATVPDDLFDKVLSVHFNKRKFILAEPKIDAIITEIWTELQPDPAQPGQGTPDDSPLYALLPSRAKSRERGSPDSLGYPVYASSPHLGPPKRHRQAECAMNALLSRFKAVWEADDVLFQKERAEADRHLSHWAQYVQIFRATYGRAPVLYDLYCGGGGFSRGAARAGFVVVGVDVRDRPLAYGKKSLGRTLSQQFERQTIQGMHYLQADVESDEFWMSLRSDAGLGPWPKPDIIHASPPCSPHSILRHLPLAHDKASASSLALIATRLNEYQAWAESQLHQHVPFSVENVEGARVEAESLGLHLSTLCGTMFGLRVFRHRLFITSAPLAVELTCSHEGKGVGKRGINRTGLEAPDYPEDALSNMYAPYSWYQPTRGTRDELHLAMGMEPGAMSSYRDLTLALPPDYGEYVSCQLMAHALQRNVGLPVYDYQVTYTQADIAEVLVKWATEGYWPAHKCRTPSQASTFTEDMAAFRIQTYIRRSPKYDAIRAPSGAQSARLAPLTADSPAPDEPDAQPSEPDESEDDDEAESAAPAADPPAKPPKGGRRKRTPIQPLEFKEDDGTPPDWKGPWSILLETQLHDPEGRAIYESLTRTAPPDADWGRARQRQARRHRAKYHLHAGRIHAMTPNGPRIFVPFSVRYALTSVTHRTLDLGGHRGLEPLYNQLASRYYWDGLLSDCHLVVSHCEVCRVRDLSHQAHPRFAAMPDPPHPFHTIYIDYKDVPSSTTGAKGAILIVVDGLTRYTIALAAANKTAEETFRLLVIGVFTTHSCPSVIRSDNGPEFVNELSVEVKKYAGYRHVRVLPYNARANGKAESTVKRVQELLIKHCRLLDNWAETLPMVCFALNCTKHSSTDHSPFYTLYGREPVLIPEMEDPSGYRVTYSGPEFLRNLVHELRRAWDTVRNASEEIRTSVIKRGERSRAHWDSSSAQDGCAGIHVGDWVLLKHGSDAHAKIRRKHGYPAYRRFRVVRIIPEAAAVELDVRGLTIQPVVSVRQCKRAPDEWYLFNDGSLSSGRYDGPLTLAGARGNPHEVGGRTGDQSDEDEADTHQDGCMYRCTMSNGS